MTKKEIVKKIAAKYDVPQLTTKNIVDETFEAIVETLLHSGRIELRNFGVFEVKQRKARKARNPKTGDKVDVPPKNVVTFKPGKEMGEKVRKLKKIPKPVVLKASDGDQASNGAEPKAKKPAATAGKPAKMRKSV